MLAVSGVAAYSANATLPTADTTTYLTVVEGKTITMTSAKPTPSAVQLQPTSSSPELTTYVTVVAGKTITMTTEQPSISAPVLANGAPAAGAGLAALAAGALYLL